VRVILIISLNMMYSEKTRNRAVDLRRAGMTLAEITERTKVSETQIGRWCNQKNVTPETGVGYVYLLHCKQIGRTKIGRARDVYSRLSDAKTLSPLPVTLVGRIQTEDAHQLERQLQEQHQDCHVRREWFEISVREAKDIVQEYGGLLEGEVPETGRYTQNLQGDIDFSG